MSRLPLKQLKRLPFKTRSGVVLGRVRDCLIETEGQQIMQYIVAARPFATKTFLIGRDQILSIQSDAVIVDDAAAASAKAETSLPHKSRTAQTGPVALRDEAGEI